MDNDMHTTKKWDVFISHASEDKESVAIPLADYLKRAGLRVWLDAHVLSLGDSLREKIEQGLAASRFGVVIISPDFLKKRWPARELNGLMALEEDGEKVILPIWHQISKSEITQHSPILADRLAADTSKGIPAVASQIVDVVLYRSHKSPSTSFPTLTRRLVELIDTGPIAEEIADFLCHHHKILTSAFGYVDVGQLAFDSQKGYVFFGARSFTPRIINVYGIAFSSSKGPVFASARPAEGLYRLIEHIKTSNPGKLAFSLEVGWRTRYQRTVILAGRRKDYSDADQTLLQELNHSLSDEQIEIRSYDWLIDACLRVGEYDKLL